MIDPLTAFAALKAASSSISTAIKAGRDLTSMGGGNLTTGGTESTILALKAYKKYKKKNFTFIYT